MQLSEELAYLRKGSINIKNKDNKYFCWCHIKHLNPVKKILNRLANQKKAMVASLKYCGIEFPVFKKVWNHKIEIKNVSYWCISMWK